MRAGAALGAYRYVNVFSVMLSIAREARDQPRAEQLYDVLEALCDVYNAAVFASA
jgi:hypothetical protein